MVAKVFYTLKVLHICRASVPSFSSQVQQVQNVFYIIHTFIYTHIHISVFKIMFLGMFAFIGLLAKTLAENKWREKFQ